MYGIVYVVNMVSLVSLVEEGYGELVAQALVLPVIVTLSFCLNKFWVFEKMHRENP